MKNTWCLWILLLLGGTLFGQSSYQFRELISKATPQPLDSLSILPGSVYCMHENDTVSTELFEVNYIDKTIVGTFDIKRNISYYYIDDQLVLVNDMMSGWFGTMFKNYHTPKSIHFNDYKNKLIDYQEHNQLTDNNFYYSVKTINN